MVNQNGTLLCEAKITWRSLLFRLSPKKNFFRKSGLLRFTARYNFSPENFSQKFSGKISVSQRITKN